jgi:hypothetical protein
MTETAILSQDSLFPGERKERKEANQWRTGWGGAGKEGWERDCMLSSMIFSTQTLSLLNRRPFFSKTLMWKVTHIKMRFENALARKTIRDCFARAIKTNQRLFCARDFNLFFVFFAGGREVEADGDGGRSWVELGRGSGLGLVGSL